MYILCLSRYHYYGLAIRETSIYYRSVYSKNGLTRYIHTYIRLPVYCKPSTPYIVGCGYIHCLCCACGYVCCVSVGTETHCSVFIQCFLQVFRSCKQERGTILYLAHTHRNKHTHKQCIYQSTKAIYTCLLY